jgi:tRNA 2-(methylsulfanyl)-N6-isopentenyladenosine37 hydroxylase
MSMLMTMSNSPHKTLPLLSRTPEAWAEQVMREPLALLNDHAYLEKKAAANALELLNRWPEPRQPRLWVATLAGIARDEAAHLAMVCRLLQRRGGSLDKTHKNSYATALRERVRRGKGTQELLDRLLVSALIEARSCERFEILGRVSSEADLARLYQNLYTSESKHFAVFLRLAALVRPEEEVATRWHDFLVAEAEILAAEPPGPRMHGGYA